MTWPDHAGILVFISGISGFLGTVALFKGTFAFESPSVYADEALIKGMNKRNRQRTLLQQIGLSLLGFSFVMELASVFVK